MSDNEKTGAVPDGDDGPAAAPAAGHRGAKRVAMTLACLAVAIACAAGVGYIAAVGAMVGSQGDQDPMTPTTAQQAADGSAGQQGAEEHQWVPQYKTVHHDAVTHSVHHDATYRTEKRLHAVCNTCGQVVDGRASEHLAATGHAGVTANVPRDEQVVDREAYDEQVVDEPAWDEQVVEGYVCPDCGATREP